MTRLVLLCCCYFYIIQLQAQCTFSVNVPSDITICSPEQIDLVGSVAGGEYIGVEWVGSNGFTDDQLITNDTPQESTTYTLTAFGTTDLNLVENGDFEDGNTGFTSSYLNGEIFCPTGPFNPWGSLGCEGMYVITDDPSSTHTNFSACGDHTTGSGMMMVVNGSASAINIWCQNIDVIPNTDYLFSAWATSVNPSSPAILQFSINGSLIGSDFGLSGTLCAWENFTAPWNAGASSTATICITNQNTALGGNDFALDDIEFIEVCKEENSFDVTIAEVLGTLPSSNDIDCDNPTVDLSVSPNNSNYMYNWEANFGGMIDGPIDQATVTASSQGLYSVTITDENGCTKKISSSVFGSTALPESNIVGDFEITCDENEVTVFATNTESGMTYDWIGSSDNSTSPFATYDMGGNFVLQLTNEYNCTSLIPFNIMDNVIQPDYELVANDTLACIGDTISISAQFDEIPENIQWYNPNGDPLSNEQIVDVGDVGYYIIEMEYSNNCNFTDSVLVISQISALDYTLGESPLLNCIDTLQELSIEVNDDFNQISWYNDTLISNASSIEISNPGIYTVEVEDMNGCITRDTLEVFQDISSANYSVESSVIDCFDGEGTISVNTDSLVQISWEFPDGSFSTADSFSTAIAGDYILRLENTNGCEINDTIELMANQDFPVLALDFDSLNCFQSNGTIAIQSNIENTEYSWTGPNNFTSTDSTFTVSETGIYIYTATTENGCSSSDTVEIIGDFSVPSLTLSGDTISCANLTATIQLTSNTDYDIIDVNTVDIVDINDNSVQVGAAGNTSITIQAMNGCTSTETIEIHQNFTLPSFETLDDITINCYQDNVLLSAEPNGNESVIWFQNADTLSESTDLLISEEGLYNIIYTHPESGCSLIDNVEVTADFQADAFDIQANHIDCIESTSIIELTTTQSFDLINFDDIALNQDSENTFSTTEAGTYTFEITYSNGCTSENFIEITIDTVAPSITVQDIMLPCTDDPIEISVETNLNTVQYDWSGPNNYSSSMATDLVNEAGIYEIILTNTENGCTSMGQVEVEENNTVIVADLASEQPLCFGELGSISLSEASGGSAPYNITISDDNNTLFDGSELESGIYFIDITDADGCLTSEMIEINTVSDFFVEAGQNTVIASGSDFEIQASTDLMDSEINSISWTPSALLSCSDCLNPTIELLEEDTWFYIEIENQNGCVHIDSIEIRVIVAYEFYEPNVFTPNNDGTNDIFYIHSNTFASNSIIREFSIYDRWGNQVFTDNDFTPNDPEHGWDGSFKGQKALSGVYAYYALVELPDGNIEKLIGSVTITR